MSFRKAAVLCSSQDSIPFKELESGSAVQPGLFSTLVRGCQSLSHLNLTTLDI